MSRDIAKTLVIEGLELENDRLRKKVEILEKAVRGVENLIVESAGVYWDYPNHPGGRPVGNLMLSRWHEIYGDDSRFNYLQEFCDALKFLKEEKNET
jgi:hypothetical protein